jgi:hypothetical protein
MRLNKRRRTQEELAQDIMVGVGFDNTTSSGNPSTR